MKRTWEGSVLTLDLEDGQPPISADVSKFPADIRDQTFRFGAATKLRNYTAGKDPEKAREALTKGISELMAGNWGVEREKVELSSAEQVAVVNGYIVAQKRLKGDTRPEGDIIAAYRALPEDKRLAVEKKHEKQIKKAMNERLKAKKGGGADVGI
jgi:hypothetical protein